MQLNLDGPTLSDTELGVHIMYVTVESVLGPAQAASLGTGAVGAATLSQVGAQVGQALPTDIVVFAGQPYHMAGLPGHKREPHVHPKVHDDFPETILVISISKAQTAVWWRETRFDITSIKPSTHPHANGCYPQADSAPAPYPFAAVPPLPTTREERVNGRTLYVARSTVPISSASRHMYKIEFT